MQEVSRQNLIPGTEYYFERIPHRDDECHRFIGTFWRQNTYFGNFFFYNVRCENPDKKPSVNPSPDYFKSIGEIYDVMRLHDKDEWRFYKANEASSPYSTLYTIYSPLHGGGRGTRRRLKIRKSRKSRKSKKNKKSRKSRKSRKYKK